MYKQNNKNIFYVYTHVSYVKQNNKNIFYVYIHMYRMLNKIIKTFSMYTYICIVCQTK